MQEIIRCRWGESTLGEFLIAISEQGVVALEFSSEKGSLEQDLRNRFPDAKLVMAAPELDSVVEKAIALIEDPVANTELVADLRGSDFQRQVWEALQRIPAGKTTTYGELASRLGMPGKAQSVGAACGANTIAVLVPCHRVIRKDGTASGYRWGLTRKLALLGREHVANFPLT